MKHIIAETIKDLKEWMKAYDEHPIDYWNYRWDYLRRRLKNMSDMESGTEMMAKISELIYKTLN